MVLGAGRGIGGQSLARPPEALRWAYSTRCARISGAGYRRIGAADKMSLNELAWVWLRQAYERRREFGGDAIVLLRDSEVLD